MISLTLSLTEKTKEEIYSQWLGIIKRRDSGSVVHLPHRDQLYRVHSFLQSKEILRKYLKPLGDYQFILLDLAAQPIDDPKEFLAFVRDRINPSKKRAILLLLDADKLIDEKRSLLASLDGLYHTMPAFSLLYFFRRNISDPRFAKTISPFTTIYQNISIFPFLKKEDSIHFVQYLAKKFETGFPSGFGEKVVKECLGIPMLIKQACRHYAKTKDLDNLFTHAEMQIKLRILWDEFETWEKHLLEKIVRNETLFNSEEKEVLRYFLLTNTIRKKGSSYYLNALILETFVKKQLRDKLAVEITPTGNIVINGITMDSHFSKRERHLLIRMLAEKETIISRDEAAQTIWREQYRELYTDWALDQFIRRLRTKLCVLGFDKTFIKTVKNRGFMISAYAE